MHKDSYFRMLFAVLVVIALLHIFGIKFYFYWQFAYYDWIVHFLGGFWIGGMSIWGINRYLKAMQLFTVPTIILSVTCAFLVGILWEYFELFIDAVLISEEEYITDTIIDLTLDTLGALCASVAYVRYGAKKPQ